MAGSDVLPPQSGREWIRRSDRDRLRAARNLQQDPTEVIGEGFTPTAAEVLDWNDDDALINGFFTGPVGAINTPNSAKVWSGISTVTEDGLSGVQLVWSLDDPPQMWLRRWVDADDGSIPDFTDWTEASGLLGGGIDDLDYSVDGTVSVGTDDKPRYNDRGRTVTISKVRIGLATGPVGSDLTVQLYINGSPTFSGTGLSVPDGSNTVLGVPDLITAWPDGEALTLEVTQVGSTTPGADMTVTVIFE